MNEMYQKKHFSSEMAEFGAVFRRVISRKNRLTLTQTFLSFAAYWFDGSQRNSLIKRKSALKGTNTGKLGNYEYTYCRKRPQIQPIDAIYAFLAILLYLMGYTGSF